MTYMVKQSNAGFGLFDDDPWEDTVYTFNPVEGMKTIIDNVVAAVKSVPAAAAPASDAVNAFSGSSISAADFNANCKAKNAPAFAAVQNLQRQLSRVGSVKGLGTTGADGQVGPGTLGLLRKVQKLFPQVMGDASSCLYVSADADVIGDQVKDVADSLNAPASVPVASKAATIVTKSGLLVTPPGAPPASLLGAFSGVTPMQGLALAGLAGGIGYLLLRKKKGASKKRGK